MEIKTRRGECGGVGGEGKGGGEVKRKNWKIIAAFSVLPFALDHSIGLRPAGGHGYRAAETVAYKYAKLVSEW